MNSDTCLACADESHDIRSASTGFYCERHADEHRAAFANHGDCPQCFEPASIPCFEVDGRCIAHGNLTGLEHYLYLHRGHNAMGYAYND